MTCILALLGGCPGNSGNGNSFFNPDFLRNGRGTNEGNSEVRRLFRDGTRIPSSHEVVEATSNPGSFDPNCERCRVPGMGEVTYAADSYDTETGRAASGADFSPETTTLSGDEAAAEAERSRLFQEILQAGPDRLASTYINLGNEGCFEVLNDNPTTLDGRYLAYTFPEAQQLAEAWGYQIPTEAQAMHIGTAVRGMGNQVPAITRLPNDRAQRYSNLEWMMNNERMHERAETGRTQIIDGHFKWYTTEHHDRPLEEQTGQIYGFARANGTFYQSTSSDAHSRDRGYFDYSHGVRLIRPTSSSNCTSQL